MKRKEMREIFELKSNIELNLKIRTIGNYSLIFISETNIEPPFEHINNNSKETKINRNRK